MRKFNIAGVFLIAGIFFLYSSFLVAQQYLDKYGQQSAVESPLGTPTRALLNIANISSWQYNDGRSGIDPNSNAGVIYPRATANVVFQDGFVWGGITQDPNTPQLRVGGQTYRIGTQGGKIISIGVPEDPNAPHVRIYKVRMDYLTLTHGQLLQEAAEFFMVPVGQVTQAMTDSLKSQYTRDWNEWPAQYGAPFNDINGNGVYEPALGEYPGVANADQVLWFVCNDLNPALTTDLYGSPPMGLELQVTVWGYNQPGAALGQFAFRRYRFINKSGFQIDSMYIAQWSDPDIGAPGNDLVGCDSLRGLGYGYNGQTQDIWFLNYALAPSALGYLFLQGPVVPGQPGDTATFDYKRIPGYKNLPMTSFGYFNASNPVWSDPQLGNYDGTLEWYNLLRGFITTTDVNNPTPFIVGSGPNTGQATKFPLSGDPVNDPTGVLGDVDGQGNNFPPGDRRLAICSGPFTMMPGDTQEVIIAMVGGSSGPSSIGNNILSLAMMKNNIQVTFPTNIEKKSEEKLPQDFTLSQNYPNPFNPKTTIEFSIPKSEFVTLKIYNLLGEEVATLVSDRLTTGVYKYEWSRTDGMASGIYFYQLHAGEFVEVRKMLLIK